MPISTPSSTAQDITGQRSRESDQRDSVSIFAAVKQIFGSGPAATVKPQATDLSSGAFIFLVHPDFLWTLKILCTGFRDRLSLVMLTPRDVTASTYRRV